MVVLFLCWTYFNQKFIFRKNPLVIYELYYNNYTIILYTINQYLPGIALNTLYVKKIMSVCTLL